MGLLLEIVVVLVLIKTTATTFSCPRANGSYVNPDDYRTYYSCSNYCPTLRNCPSHRDFYSRTDQICKTEPTEWHPRFDLTGSHNSPSTYFVRQDGYNVFFTCDTLHTDQTFIGRYINETQIVGILWSLRKLNNCIYSFNAQITATGPKAYCYKETLHEFSSNCSLNIVNVKACYQY